MMGKFKKYEKYQSTGIEWMNTIPSDWEVMKVKNLFLLITKPAPKNNDEELLSVYTDIGVRPRKDLEERGNKASTTDNYWLVKKGDIIVNKLLAWMGAIGISEYNGVTSPAYDILRHKPNVNPKFYNFLFRNKIIRHELKRHSKGIMDMRLRLYFDEFGQIRVPLPPILQQNRIVEFIESRTKQIDNFIQLKEKTIALLQERKAAIINQTVTKGLDPNVPMKDSGIEWLGEIPEHWELKKLKYLSKIKTGEKDTIDRKPEGEYPFFVRSDNVERISSYSFDGEAVLTAGDGAGVAKVFHYINGKFDYHQRVYKISNFKEVLGRYFFYYMKYNFIKEVMKISAKTTVDSLRLPMLLNFSVSFPKIKEQLRIVDYITNFESNINITISNAENEITLIKEYRESLISAAVTGKIDVREYQKAANEYATAKNY